MIIGPESCSCSRVRDFRDAELPSHISKSWRPNVICSSANTTSTRRTRSTDPTTTHSMDAAAADAVANGEKQERGYILGVDEAGRGPVLGSMVYGVCWCPDDEQELLKSMGFADSKVLTAEQRDTLFDDIQKSPLLGWAVDVITPQRMSAHMLNVTSPYNLNAIAHDSTIRLIQGVLDAGVNVTGIYVDTVGPPESYQAKLKAIFPHCTIVVCKKADSIYPIVSAASICAKVSRDRDLDAYATAWRRRSGHSAKRKRGVGAESGEEDEEEQPLHCDEEPQEENFDGKENQQQQQQQQQQQSQSDQRSQKKQKTQHDDDDGCDDLDVEWRAKDVTLTSIPAYMRDQYEGQAHGQKLKQILKPVFVSATAAAATRAYKHTRFGCGYPGDKETVQWLDDHFNAVFGWPQIVRFSWGTAKKMFRDNGVAVEWADDDDEQKPTSMSLTSMWGSTQRKSVVAQSRRHRFYRQRHLRVVTSFDRIE